jgi:hemerythrin-like metal-binding protein
MQWGPEYSVQISSFDDDHKILFDLINELHEAMMSGDVEHVAPSIMKRSLDYTNEHFKSEEQAMLRTGYLLYDEHRKQHEALIFKLTQICETYYDGNTEISSKLLGTLRNWLRTHILRDDAMYSEHLKENGIQ